ALRDARLLIGVRQIGRNIRTAAEVGAGDRIDKCMRRSGCKLSRIDPEIAMSKPRHFPALVFVIYENLGRLFGFDRENEVGTSARPGDALLYVGGAQRF